MRVLRATMVTLVIGLGGAASAVASGPRLVIDDVAPAPRAFSRPTEIDNPLAPIAQVDHAIALGVDDGEPLRVETTVLPETKTIWWKGASTEVLVSQYLAMADGRLVEVAYDWFAQDDDGDVWYFGEDVFNYERGKVANTNGSWIAGRDGPPGLLMPNDPQVGDVFHPENIPGLVFEEDRVVSTTETIAGPQGPIEDVLEIREELMDGTVEQKFWAPGYGEFRALTPGEEDVSMVFAFPNDVQPDESPEALTVLHDRVVDAFDLARDNNIEVLADVTLRMFKDWRAYGPSERTIVIDEFVEAVDDGLAELARATAERDGERAAVAAVELELAVLDVMTTHDGRTDALRIEALRRQRTLELTDDDRASAAGTKALIAALRDRSS
jgi:hypothetical protein